jgi:hypothetical protein
VYRRHNQPATKKISYGSNTRRESGEQPQRKGISIQQSAKTKGAAHSSAFFVDILASAGRKAGSFRPMR